MKLNNSSKRVGICSCHCAVMLENMHLFTFNSLVICLMKSFNAENEEDMVDDDELLELAAQGAEEAAHDKNEGGNIDDDALLELLEEDVVMSEHVAHQAVPATVQQAMQVDNSVLGGNGGEGDVDEDELIALAEELD
jgi:hypothetical protein